MASDPIEEAARILAEARQRPTRMEGLPASLQPADEAAAYAVQTALHERLTAAGGGAVVGHKIGCTTAVMQAYLKISSPCAGGVFAPTVAWRAATLSHARYVRMGVECELAVRLGRDLPARGGPYRRDTVASAVDAVMAAIEIVDDRWVDYHRVDTPTLIADDFFGAGCVLGEPVSAWRRLDLQGLGGTMTISGELAGHGRGADILGHPFEALAWLANRMLGRGSALRAGEFVLLGSLVATRWLARGDTVSVEIDGLGGASARLQ